MNQVFESSAEPCRFISDFWEWDIGMGTLSLSQSLRERLGYPEDVAASHPLTWRRIIHPDDYSEFKKQCQELYRRNQVTPLITEIRFIRCDGTAVPFLLYGRNVETEKQASLPRAAGFVIDLSTAKVEEMMNRKNRKVMTDIISKAHIHLVYLDRDFNFIAVNDEYARTCRKTPGELIGKNHFEFYPNEENEKIFTQVRDTGREVIYHDKPFVFPDQPERGITYWDWKLSPVLGNGGSVEGLVFSLVETTDRKRMELALRESETRFRTALESMLEGCQIIGLDWRYIYINPAAEKHNQRPKEELIGERYMDKWPGIENTEVFRAIKDTLENRVPHTMENEFEFPNGAKGWFTLSIQPVPEGVFILSEDITARKRALEQLNRNQRLESLGILAGGIAHDFNNLLSGIFGYIDMAAETSRDQEVILYLKKSLTAIERARGLTGQLLTFSKGGAPLRKTENIVPFIADTVSFIMSGSTVKCNYIMPDMLLCDFDRNQIGQVIDNIVINALQAMPAGGVITVTAGKLHLDANEIGDLETGSYVTISIRDTGIGIPQNIITRVFDPFFTTKDKGHGLGLAMCFSIIRRHGGTMTVASESGHGSLFTIYLPASAATAATMPQMTKISHRGSGNIILMDDEKVILDAVGSMLRSFGYSVVKARNGDEVCTLLQSPAEPPSGIILDLTVPGGRGGKEIIGDIRKRFPDTPVFVASGYTEDPILASPAAFGFTAAIAKPFLREELAFLLEKYMNPVEHLIKT